MKTMFKIKPLKTDYLENNCKFKYIKKNSKVNPKVFP